MCPLSPSAFVEGSKLDCGCCCVSSKCKRLVGSRNPPQQRRDDSRQRLGPGASGSSQMHLFSFIGVNAILPETSGYTQSGELSMSKLGDLTTALGRLFPPTLNCFPSCVPSALPAQVLPVREGRWRGHRAGQQGGGGPSPTVGSYFSTRHFQTERILQMLSEHLARAEPSWGLGRARMQSLSSGCLHSAGGTKSTHENGTARSRQELSNMIPAGGLAVPAGAPGSIKTFGEARGGDWHLSRAWKVTGIRKVQREKFFANRQDHEGENVTVRISFEVGRGGVRGENSLTGCHTWDSSQRAGAGDFIPPRPPFYTVTAPLVPQPPALKNEAQSPAQ